MTNQELLQEKKEMGEWLDNDPFWKDSPEMKQFYRYAYSDVKEPVKKVSFINKIIKYFS